MRPSACARRPAPADEAATQPEGRREGGRQSHSPPSDGEDVGAGQESAGAQDDAARSRPASEPVRRAPSHRRWTHAAPGRPARSPGTRCVHAPTSTCPIQPATSGTTRSRTSQAAATGPSHSDAARGDGQGDQQPAGRRDQAQAGEQMPAGDRTSNGRGRAARPRRGTTSASAAGDLDERAGAAQPGPSRSRTRAPRAARRASRQTSASDALRREAGSGAPATVGARWVSERRHHDRHEPEHVEPAHGPA